MAEERLDTLGCLKGANSAPNPLDPDLLTARERVAEVASLLARGFLRSRLRSARKCQRDLAIPAEPSDSCLKPKSAGERHE